MHLHSRSLFFEERNRAPIPPNHHATLSVVTGACNDDPPTPYFSFPSPLEDSKRGREDVYGVLFSSFFLLSIRWGEREEELWRDREEELSLSPPSYIPSIFLHSFRSPFLFSPQTFRMFSLHPIHPHPFPLPFSAVGAIRLLLKSFDFSSAHSSFSQMAFFPSANRATSLPSSSSSSPAHNDRVAQTPK